MTINNTSDQEERKFFEKLVDGLEPASTPYPNATPTTPETKSDIRPTHKQRLTRLKNDLEYMDGLFEYEGEASQLADVVLELLNIVSDIVDDLENPPALMQELPF